eukprot:comp23649_c0_seq1/m.59090 comp23649_c0_seq1/g.59090  ORF comp23649_c0_seq1/g.59090 comp23649_c0_seq1/m.59090 type:complete len:760 (+) comp23649_c0_seq1:276-2555(+)
MLAPAAIQGAVQQPQPLLAVGADPHLKKVGKALSRRERAQTDPQRIVAARKRVLVRIARHLLDDLAVDLVAQRGTSRQPFGRNLRKQRIRIRHRLVPHVPKQRLERPRRGLGLKPFHPRQRRVDRRVGPEKEPGTRLVLAKRLALGKLPRRLKPFKLVQNKHVAQLLKERVLELDRQIDNAVLVAKLGRSLELQLEEIVRRGVIQQLIQLLPIRRVALDCLETLKHRPHLGRIKHLQRTRGLLVQFNNLVAQRAACLHLSAVVPPRVGKLHRIHQLLLIHIRHRSLDPRPRVVNPLGHLERLHNSRLLHQPTRLRLLKRKPKLHMIHRLHGSRNVPENLLPPSLFRSLAPTLLKLSRLKLLRRCLKQDLLRILPVVRNHKLTKRHREHTNPHKLPPLRRPHRIVGRLRKHPFQRRIVHLRVIPFKRPAPAKRLHKRRHERGLKIQNIHSLLRRSNLRKPREPKLASLGQCSLKLALVPLRNTADQIRNTLPLLGDPVHALARLVHRRIRRHAANRIRIVEQLAHRIVVGLGVLVGKLFQRLADPDLFSEHKLQPAALCGHLHDKSHPFGFLERLVHRVQVARRNRSLENRHKLLHLAVHDPRKIPADHLLDLEQGLGLLHGPRKLQRAMRRRTIQHTRLPNLDLRPVAGHRLEQRLAPVLEVWLVSLGIEQAISFVKVLVRVTEREPRLADSHGLKHTGIPQLLQNHRRIVHPRLLLRVWLDAANVVRLRRPKGAHQRRQLVAELRPKRLLALVCIVAV